jgi:hypothetical protein
MYRYIDTERTDGHTDRKAGRQTDRQTARRKDKQKDAQETIYTVKVKKNVSSVERIQTRASSAVNGERFTT